MTEQEIFGNFGKDFPLGESCCKKIAASCKEEGFTCSDSCDSSKEIEVDKNGDGLEYVCEDRAKPTCCKPKSP